MHPRTAVLHSEWSPEMLCFVDALEADPVFHEATVHVPRHNATDMGGCIRVVKRIDPLVTSILVYEGGRPDILYRRDAEGWTAWLVIR
jgi:hypothetical protein